MIQRRELRDTSRDIDEYQSFRETFQDEDKVLSDGVRLAKETQRLQDVLGDHEVSHAVQLREASDQNPSNRIYAPVLSDSYTQLRQSTDIEIVGPSQMQALLRYVSDYVREDIYPAGDCFVIPRYFYQEKEDYVT